MTTTYTAFSNEQQIAAGTLEQVARQGKTLAVAGTASMLVFDDQSGEQLEIDLHGSIAEIEQRLKTSSQPAVIAASSAPRTPGRPKLGVVAREVTLLPRHWQWLNSQSGGASVALRKLVEQASRSGEPANQRRKAQEASYRFMSAMAGNLAGFEEATRALFANNAEQFRSHTESWPQDIRDHARKMASAAFSNP